MGWCELPIRNAQVFIALPDLLTAGERRNVERELALELSLDMVSGAHMRCLCSPV